MRLLCTWNEFELYEYCPTMNNLFGIDFKPHSALTRIRFIIELVKWGGYKVYYLKIKNTIIASCIVSNGINPRYWFACENDVIVGPYYVSPKFRGMGYSHILLKLILEKMSLNYTYAFDYIHVDNIQSIKATEKAGFEFYAKVDISEITHRIRKNDKGDYLVYRYRKVGDMLSKKSNGDIMLFNNPS